MRIVSVVGTRPQLIKAAALGPALRARLDEVFVDTGQHYDDTMAGAFFQELNLPRPDHSLGIGGGSGADQVGRMLIALDGVLRDESPDAVLVYGDTNSTLAGALAAVKLGLPVGHVEAGLRSFDRRMPEELNRVVADHASRWLFAPTQAAMTNLAAEGLADRAVLVGDLMQDLVARMIEEVRDPAIVGSVRPGLAPGGYLFATIHRAENRIPDAMRSWSVLLGSLATSARPVVLSLHPGTQAALTDASVDLPPNVIVLDPQGFRTTLALQLHAAAVITDSGGIQREAAWLGVPCLILRSTTEWVEAVAGSGGTMAIVGLDAGLAMTTLARIAPASDGDTRARDRAARVSVAPAGAVDAIVTALVAGIGPTA